MGWKRIAIVGLLVGATVVGCACGDKDPLLSMSKKELAQMIKDQSGDISKGYAEIERLRELIIDTQGEESLIASISTMDDGSGRLTFNSIRGKIKFEKPLEYPGSGQAPNTSSVGITNSLSIVPTNNWVVVLEGTSIELEHTSGISGIIKAGQIKELYNRDMLQEEVMEPFFESIPSSRTVFSKLFLDDQWWGLEGKAETMINEAPSYIRCGMVGLGEQSFTYIFLYNGERDSNKEESILSLLKTLKMFGKQLRIE